MNLMEEILNKILNEIQGMKSQLSENTQILKALEHAAEVNKAVQDKMQIDIAEIRGEVTSLRKDLNTVEMVTAKNWNDINELKFVK